MKLDVYLFYLDTNNNACKCSHTFFNVFHTYKRLMLNQIPSFERQLAFCTIFDVQRNVPQ